jgi:hypothetical protein
MMEQPPAYYCDVPSVKSHTLKACLRDHYHIDESSMAPIMLKLKELIDSPNGYHVIDDFIEKSALLDIQFVEGYDVLGSDDGVLRAPEWHEVLFESPSVRVLWGESMPGDTEPPHTHYWRSLMLITSSGTFEINNADGSAERDVWPIGVYALPPETSPSSYTNIGSTAFRALRFEIKK